MAGGAATARDAHAHALEPKQQPHAQEVATTTRKHPFWDTQPVPKLDEAPDSGEQGPIELDQSPDQIRQTPYPLPAGFMWSTIDPTNETEIGELYALLEQNYVEDDDADFRFRYAPEFLRWALCPPGWHPSWHVAVRASKSGKLLAFISGIPSVLGLRGRHQPLVDINFLCVHKQLRSKRMAPVLIREVTRQCHLLGTFQAVYTAGVYLPTPVAVCRYWHRSLVPRKLVDVGFSALPRGASMAQHINRYRLPQQTATPGLRPMREADVPAVTQLLAAYLTRFPLAPILTEEEVRHWLLPRKNVLYSYVVDADSTPDAAPRDAPAITQFVSFYSLPSTVIGHPKHDQVRAAYLYYYATAMDATAAAQAAAGAAGTINALRRLINDTLILAHRAGFDVFNCLDLGDNHHFTEPLLFARGSGELHYYTYNYRVGSLTPQEVGLVMI
ncbi:hypothetical protein CXG81DRAFT_10699 [Caulochytrium protostelioides]|uniref:Glycylpeptide N-tetradecanoyltransferase n=1 Tax=Caulochytrium protostelioides TaxID=1555241 RepID=A0A4P9XAZ5_9FUNG|nr:hypothetical protein CXG81DRAFT_10699 [Caulochytrium protostelioides]|eukprot:RKP02515.1 hypothetical protein CXG81DRAFT_10699 [Caulochytrium protostelioides]